MRAAAVVICLLLPSTAAAQAWTRDQGKGYVNLTFSGVTGTQVYNPDFTKQELPTRFTQLILGLYGEVGIIDRWLTLKVQSELLRRSVLSDQGATLGLGDSKLGLYTGLLDSPVRLTFGVDVGLPTGDPDPSAGDGADAEAEQIARSLPTGDGEVDIEPRALLGYSFGGGAYPLQHYLVASIGYAIRTKGFADAISYSFEIGSKIDVAVLDRFWFTIKLSGVESFADDEAAARGAAGLGNGVTYTSLGFGLSVQIYKGLGAIIQYDTAFRARSIIAAAPIRGGLSYEF